MKRVTAFLAAVTIWLGIHAAHSCGIDWNSLPQNHFDGVNEFGFVSVWKNIGSIDLGDGLRLPLNTNFRSDRTTSSSTLGSGWHLALVDANITQIDERTFMMFDPAGPFRFFWRDSKNPSLLSGQAGWKAEIRGDSITAWADCGVKLVFSKGKIASMQLKDRVLTYYYQNGQFAEIRDGTTPVLKVVKKPITGEVTGLTLGSKQTIQIEYGNRPRVQTVNDHQIIGGVEKTLSKVTQSDGTTITYDYAVDQKLNSTVKIANRLLTWNSTTKMIVSDDGWTYDIKPSENRFSKVAIARSDVARGQKEFWYYDSVKGVEESLVADGRMTKRTWFTSGELTGKIRHIITYKDGNLVQSKNYFYNEDAILVRITDNNDIITFEHDEYGRLLKQKNNGEVSSKRIYSPDGNIFEQFYSDGSVRKHIKKTDALCEDTRSPDGSVTRSLTYVKNDPQEVQQVRENVAQAIRQSNYLAVLQLQTPIKPANEQ